MRADTHQTPQERGPSTVTRREVSVPELWVLAPVVLAGGAVLRSALAVWSANQGFLEYNADGFARVIRGYEWLQAPRWEVDVWLPLHFWVYGTALWVWDDIYLVPRLINFSLGLAIIVGVYFIGAKLVDRRVGAIAALLVAVFPYEVWLSISGMSEPLFHALIVYSLLGFTIWWRDHSGGALLVAGICLAGATAVRYEAWFFVAVFAPLVLAIGFLRDRESIRYPLASAAVAGSFMLLWLQQNWAARGDALAFARETEAIKLAEVPTNVESSLLERITYFPEVAFTTSPGVILFGTLASVLLLTLDRQRWWPLLAIIWGQAALLVGVTSAFASQGPGAERYMLINTILLCLPIVWLAIQLVDRFRVSGVLIAGGMILLIFVSFAPDWMSPPDDYPASDTRSLAGELEQYLSDDPDAHVVVLLPAIPDERFNEGYALRVLSEYPERVEITDTPSRLFEAVQQGDASMWVLDQRIDVNDPPAESSFTAGSYRAGYPPPPAFAESGSMQIAAGQAVTVNASDFQSEEPVSTWWTGPDESVYAGPELSTDEDGRVRGADVPLPDEARDGRWTLTLAGQVSQRQAFISVEVDE